MRVLSFLVVIIAVLVGEVLRNGPDFVLETITHDIAQVTLAVYQVVLPWPPTYPSTRWVTPGPFAAPSRQLTALQKLLNAAPGSEMNLQKSFAAKKWDKDELISLRKVMKGIGTLTASFTIPYQSLKIGGFRNSIVIYPGVPSSPDSPVIVHAHGGGASSGAPEDLNAFYYQLSRATNSRVFGVAYPLAPENPLPAGPLAIVSVYKALVEEFKVPPSKIILSGDSGGGLVAVHAILLLKENKLPKPGGLLLSSPWLDTSLSSKSFTENSGRDMFPALALEVIAYQLCPTPDKNSSLCNVFSNDLSFLPPTYVQCSSSEILRDDGIRLVDTITKLGGKAKIDIIQHGLHDIVAFGGTPEATEGLGRIAQWAKEILHS